jgi:uncharacterized protein YdeI (YjbR/CyaY-like superfamily)
MSARPSDSRNEREILKFKDRREWRKWLSRNGSKSKGVWLAIQKKSSKIEGVRYIEAVEEAICFGWIDSKVRRLDDNYFIQWYSPRKEDSVWSLINKKKAIEMMGDGKMTRSGLRSVEVAKRNGKWQIPYSSRGAIDVPDNITRMLRSHSVLRKFNSFTQSRKLQYVYWIEQAKRQETKDRRIRELIDSLLLVSQSKRHR